MEEGLTSLVFHINLWFPKTDWRRPMTRTLARDREGNDKPLHECAFIHPENLRTHLERPAL